VISMEEKGVPLQLTKQEHKYITHTRNKDGHISIAKVLWLL